MGARAEEQHFGIDSSGSKSIIAPDADKQKQRHGL